MAVFRIDKTRDYTVMSNYHLRDERLSLKAKGLLSQILSLPENWDYTLSGLAHINRESKDAVRWEQVGRTRHYSPVIAREDARREETTSFLDRVYGGRLGLMMSALVDDHALTKEDIDELSEILKKAGAEK